MDHYSSLTIMSHLWLSFNMHKIPLKSNYHIYSMGHVIYDVTISLVNAVQISYQLARHEKHSD